MLRKEKKNGIISDAQLKLQKAKREWKTKIGTKNKRQ